MDKKPYKTKKNFQNFVVYILWNVNVSKINFMISLLEIFSINTLYFLQIRPVKEIFYFISSQNKSNMRGSCPLNLLVVHFEIQGFYSEIKDLFK